MKRILLLVALFYLSFFYGIFDIALFNLDEGAFSEATREMLKGGDYITTYLGGELRFDKPVLIYWLQLLFVKILGTGEGAFRLPSSFAASLWGISIYFFVKRYFDRERAFWSLILFASALQITIIAKAAIADSLLNLFIALSMFNIWDYFNSREKKYLYFAFLFIALGTLTKGPVAILIPFAVTFIYALFKRESVFWLKSVFDPIGLLIFLFVASPWYIAEYLAQKEAFINGFFLKHNLQRFNSSFESHGGGFLYYLPVLLIGLLPFSALILKGVLFIKKLKFKSDLKLFLFIWFLFVFVFFSLSGTKLPHYVIYGYTPLFIFGSLVKPKNHFLKMVLPMIVLFCVFLFLPDIANIFVDKIKDDYARDLVLNSHGSFDIFYKIKLFVVIVLLTALFWLKDVKKTLISLSFLTLVAVNAIIIPSYASLVEEPIKEAGLFIKQHDLKNVVSYKINTPSIMVYAKRIIKRGAPKNGDIVFTKKSKLKELHKNYEILYQKNAIIIVKTDEK